jgi:hypothetical protein
MWESSGEGDDSAMIALDGSQYMALLMTKPDHSCNEFEANQ